MMVVVTSYLYIREPNLKDVVLQEAATKCACCLCVETMNTSKGGIFIIHDGSIDDHSPYLFAILHLGSVLKR